MGDDPNDEPGEFSSPPCFMHELDPTWLGLPPPDLLPWRKAERERLIKARLAVPAAERAVLTEAITAHLDEVAGDLEGKVVSAWWPFRGEPDLRPWLASAIERGATAALPVVVQKNTPLQFRAWRPGDRMERGIWNIPIPADGETVTPDLVLAPVVGFDPGCYRLGYGGGYFDRTLSTLSNYQAIGIGYALQAIPTIRPQTHDIPMQLVVTEAGVIRRP
ncbi:5-formyltetrahydrofolate cyclo-ligase [Geminicoccus flavidas]|uniref:5-formyltetrahydrofolate cyclo-ligase n=1 Tax=Geminicoccus flavidas TaxID=2506407 RepID=UPI00135B81B4|nr:5-formyltetrahydrofolate cyclo-ligase [Geminicoccus flavidas]